MNATRGNGAWSFWAEVVRNLFGFFRVVRDDNPRGRDWLRNILQAA